VTVTRTWNGHVANTLRYGELMEILRSRLLRSFPHGFTTRAGGVSPAPWDSLNLGRLVEDDPARVAENWRRVEAATRLGFARVRQVHGARVVHLRRSTEPAEEADAVVSTDAGVAACVSVADCVPVLLADPVGGAVAAVHAGWRGTMARVSDAAVRALAAIGGADPGRLLASIGPSIGPCCYEVSPDLADRFSREIGGVVRGERGHPHLDLWEANRRVLVEAGLRPEGVEVVGRCTSCDSRSFFSHRRDRGRTGRHIAFIAPPAPTAEGPLP
jgi:YfiH family protein